MSAKAAAWQPVSSHGLYDRDFQAWAFEQARLLREGRFDQIDAQHLAEEIEEWVRQRPAH